jgi:hypothetical protein
MFIQLRKVDEAQRLVYGWVDETPDHAREVMDYAKSKPRFEAWSKAQAEASDGKSYGNIRAMHAKVAAGVIPEPLEYDDEAKRISFWAKVTDEAEWTKVATGTYTGFSPGGAYGQTWADPMLKGHRRYEAIPTEMSLVDKPCIPSATFQFIKADGIVEDREFEALAKLYEPTNDEVKAEAREMAKAAGKPDSWKDHVVKARAELIKRHAEAPDGGTEVVEQTAEQRLADALAKAAAAPKPYGDVKYADPEDGKYPIDTPAHIRAAWSYVSMPKNAQLLGDKVGKVRAAIETAWKDKIDPKGPPSVEKMALLGGTADALRTSLALVKRHGEIALEKGFYNISSVARALASWADIVTDTIWEEAYEQDSESKLPQSAMDVFNAMRAHLIADIEEECEEFAEACERNGGDAIALIASAENDAIMEHAAKVGELQKAELSALSPEDLAKRGARNSKADQKHVQAAHDHMTSLGAKCDSGNCDKAASGDLQKASGEVERLNKVIADSVPVVEGLVKDRDAAVAQVADLTKRLDALERQPMPAKGVLYAVEKDGAVTDHGTGAAAAAKTWKEQYDALPPGPEKANFLLSKAAYAPGGSGR